jgi:hypothetical protein
MKKALEKIIKLSFNMDEMPYSALCDIRELATEALEKAKYTVEVEIPKPNKYGGCWRKLFIFIG